MTGGIGPFSNETTSLEAARAAAPTKHLKAAKILELIRRREHVHRGLTADEVEVLLRMHSNTVTARITDLKDEGWLFDSGQRRPTRTGRKAIVWMVRERAVPPDPQERKQTHGRLAAAVRQERARVLLAISKLADEIMARAQGDGMPKDSPTLPGNAFYAVEKVKADAIRKAANVVGERLAKQEGGGGVG